MRWSISAVEIVSPPTSAAISLALGSEPEGELLRQPGSHRAAQATAIIRRAGRSIIGGTSGRGCRTGGIIGRPAPFLGSRLGSLRERGWPAGASAHRQAERAGDERTG